MRGGAAPTHPKDISSTPPGVYIQQKYIETYGFGVDSMYITLKKMFGVVLNNLVTTRVFNVHLVLEYM